MKSKYYSEVGKTVRKKFIACRYEIKWNVPKITGSLNAEGYIVQHFSRVTTPALPFLPDKSYYEAWKITNGICDNNKLFDDGYAIALYPSDGAQNAEELVDSVVHSVGTTGKIEFFGDVYWIPRSDKLYPLICKWPIGMIKEAGNLPAVEHFFELGDVDPLFPHNFTHTWDFTDEQLIVETAARVFDNAFPKTVKDANLKIHIGQMNISDVAKNDLASKLNISNWNS